MTATDVQIHETLDVLESAVSRMDYSIMVNYCIFSIGFVQMNDFGPSWRFACNLANAAASPQIY